MQCGGFSQRREELRGELQLFASRLRKDVVLPALEEHRKELQSELLQPALAELRAQVREDLIAELGNRRMVFGASPRHMRPCACPQESGEEYRSAAVVRKTQPWAAPGLGPKPGPLLQPLTCYRGSMHNIANEQWQALLESQLREVRQDEEPEDEDDEEAGATSDDELAAMNPRQVEAVSRKFRTHATDFRQSTRGFWRYKLSLLQVALFRCASAVGCTIKAGAMCLATHPALDYVACAIVVANAVVLAIETDHLARFPGEHYAAFKWVDLVFCVFFALELGLRIGADGMELFAPANLGWTIFDSVVVACQVVDVTVQFLDKAEGFTNVSFLRLMRIFRLLRVLRLVRLFHLVVELRTMLSSIMGCMKALFWVIVLYFVLVFTAGTFFTQVVAEHRSQIAAGHHHPRELRGGHHARPKHHLGAPDDTEHQLETYYGALGTTILSLWECISGGMDWKTLFDPLLKGVSPWVAFIFLAYVVFATVAMMNVVTGVFVEHAMRYAERDQDLYLARNIIGIFGQGDLSEEGEISLSAWEAKINGQEMKSLFKALNVDPSDAKSLFKLIDLDDSGNLALTELIDGWARLRGQAKSLDLNLLIRETDRANQVSQRALQNIEDCCAWLSTTLAAVATKVDELAGGLPQEQEQDGAASDVQLFDRPPPLLEAPEEASEGSGASTPPDGAFQPSAATARQASGGRSQASGGRSRASSYSAITPPLLHREEPDSFRAAIRPLRRTSVAIRDW